MNDIKERLAQRIAEAQSAADKALVKTAGACCEHEEAKDPEQLIDGTADVQVEGNLPEGVNVPGEKGMEDSGLTPEDKGTDIGHVETNGPGVEQNAEVGDFISSAEEFEKKANALIDFAKQIIALPDSAFGGVAKQASAEITEKDVEDFIVKRADAGDPVCRGIIQYCTAVYKQASDEEGVAAEEIAEGADIEAGLAQVQEQVAASLQEKYPELTPEQAQQIAAESTAAAVQDAVQGGEVAEGEQPSEGEIAEELVAEVAKNLTEQGISEDEAEVLAVEAVADYLEGSMGKEASAEKPAEKPVKKEESEVGETKVAKKASDEEEVTEKVVEKVPAEEPKAEEAAVDENAVAEQVGQLVVGLAQEIKAQDPEISDEEALEGAAEAVEDALETAQVQQAVGATDEAGAPIVSDEDAATMVEELGKTASANPLRDTLTPAVNQLLGLSPKAFAARLGIAQ